MDWCRVGRCEGKEQRLRAGQEILHVRRQPRHICTPVTGRWSFIKVVFGSMCVYVVPARSYLLLHVLLLVVHGVGAGKVTRET